jgi:hypothetical protein
MCGATFWNGTHEAIFELDGKEVMYLTPCMLKNNQEQSTSGQVSCRHCGAVLFRKKDSPLQGNLELSAKVSRSARNLKKRCSDAMCY